jgi:hypothetical protein
MSLILDGTTGASAVQDASVTDTKLSLTANSAQIKTALNSSGSAPIYACRAWVNFNGTGTVAILASGNVSSITDNGVGDYTVNFTTAMPDANYSLSGMCRMDGAAGDANAVLLGIARGFAPLVGSVRIQSAQRNWTSSGGFDGDYITVSVFR